MFKVNKTLMASAVLIAAGFVAVADLAQSRTSETATAIVEARFPTANEAWAVLTLPGADAAPQRVKPNAAANCTHEHWPYVSDDCLSTANDKLRRPARTIPIERRVADATPGQQL
jgi:hypothetical protein